MSGSRNKKEFMNVLRGLAFIAPNVVGFLIFTLVPLGLSFAMAFTNWDLLQHNMFRSDSIGFAGLSNFRQLFQNPHFWQYLGNTAFLLIGIPFGIAGSLAAALLLHRSPHDNYKGSRTMLVCSTVLIAACIVLAAIGFRGSALMILISAILGMVLIGGVAAGSTTYRTLFYLPHFTQGVAVFILWKKLYNPTNGPVNSTLQPVIENVEKFYLSTPYSIGSTGLILCIAALLIVWAWSVRRLAFSWKENDKGTLALLLALAFSTLPLFLAWRWLPPFFGWIMLSAAAGCALWILRRTLQFPPRTACETTRGIGAALLLGNISLLLQMICIGIGLVLYGLPEWSRSGLQPPLWLADYHWAKPSLMIISLWAAIGSNNMILYLAGLSNISKELYEAADIDGAGRWQKFCHITWPQLAPITFFIVIMSFIYGLQGGFEMARTMTNGGPAGSTTTLSYYVYSEGFETGRLGYASAVAWVLFMIVFAATIFNWRFGNRYVAE